MRGHTMKKTNNRFIFGIIIIAIGVLALLNNTLFYHDFEDVFGIALFYGLAAFFAHLYRSKKAIWALIPAVIFVIFGSLILLDLFFNINDSWFGVLLFYGLAGVFIYWKERKSEWWPIIPAGVFITIGTVVLVDEFNMIDSDWSGLVFLVGMTLTFLYLWMIRDSKNKLTWAIWPASVFGVISLLHFFENAIWFNDDYILPILLIGIGAVVILTGIRKK